MNQWTAHPRVPSAEVKGKVAKAEMTELRTSYQSGYSN